jgi:hypothetical protein
MLLMSRPPLPPKNIVANNNVAEPLPNTNPTKQMSWGEPTWFLFHTLAEKVKDEYFDQIKIELFNNIISICGVLPCPICAQHATEYLRKIQINSIRTKKDFKELLFHFHNEVNKKKGYTLFSLDDLDNKYSNANTANIIKYFISVFQKKSNNVSAIATDMYKIRILQLFKGWLNLNMQKFDL